MTERKELILRLPEDIFEILKRYKETSGVSYTNAIYNAIVWWLCMKKLLKIEDIVKK